MKRFTFISLAMVMILSSCSPKFAITYSGENLSALTQVTDLDEPCITPFGGDNGQNLFFAAREKGSYYNIYCKTNPFTASMSQKTSGKNMNYMPTYSSVLGKIAFRCQNEGSLASDIFMMPATGGKALTQITETTNSFENNPCFSADGTMLVYDRHDYSYGKSYKISYIFDAPVSVRFAGNVIIEHSEIWIKNLKTGESILLGNGYQPCFSPDGKQIAYVKYSADAKSCSIWTMDLDGTNQVQVTDAKKGYAYYPRWSPDGKKLIFQASKKDKTDFDLYVVDVDGDNLTQLTINKSTDTTPYWTEDNYIYFSSDRGNKKGNYQIWRFKIDL